ncbi:MAG: acetylglutamate kinase [Actinomycetota bacterium]
MTTLDRAREQAAVLAEAVPWLQRFHGSTVVVKFGGHAMVDDALTDAFAADIVFLRLAGLRPVVVHGGGPQINARLEEKGIASEFRGGLRVTTPEVMQVVRDVLVDEVQAGLVGSISAHGVPAVGLSVDSGLLVGEKRMAIVDGEEVDVGLVGDITVVDNAHIEAVLEAGEIPVISTVARSTDGELLNVNADTGAAAIAAALSAGKLVVLTDVEGLYRDWPASDEVVASITVDELRSLLPSLSAGMVPKMEACLRAVEAGVPRAHIIDGRVPHGLLVEIFTDRGVGTLVLPDGVTS